MCTIVCVTMCVYMCRNYMGKIRVTACYLCVFSVFKNEKNAKAIVHGFVKNGVLR